jgi:predicted dinucleotide-binding enzyme
MAEEARKKGTGVASAEFLPGVRLVRAFNSLPHFSLRGEAHRAGERVGIPLASDDPEALKIAARLVEDAGFEPVIVGPLSRAKEFDVGAAVYGRALAASELRRRLNLKP